MPSISPRQRAEPSFRWRGHRKSAFHSWKEQMEAKLLEHISDSQSAWAWLHSMASLAMLGVREILFLCFSSDHFSCSCSLPLSRHVLGFVRNLIWVILPFWGVE